MSTTPPTLLTERLALRALHLDDDLVASRLLRRRGHPEPLLVPHRRGRPVDAIELTSLYNLTGRSREEMIFDKEKLLSVFDATRDREPMKSTALGGTL